MQLLHTMRPQQLCTSSFIERVLPPLPLGSAAMLEQHVMQSCDVAILLACFAMLCQTETTAEDTSRHGHCIIKVKLDQAAHR